MQFHIAQIWRYPVKSMAGELLDRSEITMGGLPFDRHWAVRDANTGDLRGGRTLGGLMQFSARFDASPVAAAPVAVIGFPDGREMATDDMRIDAALSEALDTPVVLSAVRPESDTRYYARRSALDFTPDRIRTSFGLTEDEPLTDMIGRSPAARRYIAGWKTNQSRPGTHFDTTPLHLLTEASLRHLQALAPETLVDVRRFRPNLVIGDDGTLQETVEFGWVDRRLRLGGAEVEVTWETVRCVMTTREQNSLPRAAKLMRTMVRNTGQNLGVYAEVMRAGSVAVGDAMMQL